MLDNSFLNWLNKQRHPLFNVGSREKDFLLILHFYFEWSKKLLYDPKFVCFHRPVSHHKIRFHQTVLPKLSKFFFRINWLKFNRNYRAYYSIDTFTWTFWGPPKNGVLLYNFTSFRVILDNFFRNVILDQTPLLKQLTSFGYGAIFWTMGIIETSKTFGLWWQVSTRFDNQIFISSPGRFTSFTE